ncbi:uncharacterized protein [Nicotiana sylvestris]|uniref:uncharacterized protein n=1 Tax=Nicotiana sylvestris TaxID=4096 RepID=UPI00388CA51B
MAVETEAKKYDSLFALMAQSDDDDEEDEDDEVNFRDVQRNLKSYSSKKLKSLSNVLIDAYYSLVNDKEILTVELGEFKQSRDDLVVCVVDLNETIANLEQAKEALNERITSVENERDDLMVVVVDLKETIEEETIEGLNREHRNVSLGKGKEVANESHIMLEKELTVVKTSLCSELERNQQLQTELEKARNDLEKYLKWTWSSYVVTAMYLNNSENKQGIGFQREKTPYNPHNKYVTVPDNWLWKSERKLTAMDYGQWTLKARRECILEKEVKGTFSVNEKVERFFRHSSGNEHYVNDLKVATTNMITQQVVSVDKGSKNIHSY